MSKLRKLAEGQQCQVRLPGCLHSPETVVLAHIRRGGTAGVGQKPPDLCGVWACFKCHQVIDAREFIPGLSKLEIDRYILEGLCRTLAGVSKAMAV